MLETLASDSNATPPPIGACSPEEMARFNETEDNRASNASEESDLVQLNGIWRFASLMNSDIQPPSFAVEGLLVEGQTGILAGRFSIGKTLFSLQLTISLTTGRDFLGRRIDRPYKVAFIDTENGACEIKSRIAKQVSSFNLSEDEKQLLKANWVYVDCDEEGSLQHLKLDKDGLYKLSQFVKAEGIEILILDNFGRVFPWDEQDERQIKALFNNLRSLRNNNASLQRGVILFLHHMTKPTESNQFSLLTSAYEYLSRSRGSGRLLDFSPIRLAIAEEMFASGDFYYIVNGLMRSGEVSPLVLERNPESLCFELHSNKGLVSKKVFETSPRKMELYNLLPSHFTFGQVAELKNKEGKPFSRKTISETLQVACSNGLLQKNSDGSYSRTSQERGV